MNDPIAVIISDIHFTPSTLELASQSLLKAQYKAKMLDVPLVIAGDLLDSKAIIRAECANKLLQMLSVQDKTETYIMIGNHDLINEKGTEHSLNFLWGFANIIDKPTEIDLCGERALLIPYQSDLAKLRLLLEDPENPPLLIMHQGVEGAYMGHYVQDKTSLSKGTFGNHRVISGHYHRAQDIKCGNSGLFSYVGNPYSLSFGEALDGPKGFVVLYRDGHIERIPTNLRRHIIYETGIFELNNYDWGHQNPNDLIWLKVKGPKSELNKINKKEIGKRLFGHFNFKLDLIPTDLVKVDKVEGMTDHQILDSIIDNSEETEKEKKYLKKLWREIL